MEASLDKVINVYVLKMPKFVLIVCIPDFSLKLALSI